MERRTARLRHLRHFDLFAAPQLSQSPASRQLFDDCPSAHPAEQRKRFGERPLKVRAVNRQRDYIMPRIIIKLLGSSDGRGASVTPARGARSHRGRVELRDSESTISSPPI